MRFFSKKPKHLSPEELDSSLLDAAREGRTEAVQTLLADGADMHVWDDKALCYAVDNGHTETARALLAAGANVHVRSDWALNAAACCGHSDMVKVLLAAGANVHTIDDAALRSAATNGYTEVVRVLLAAGADVHARDDQSLRNAVHFGLTETVRVLARHIFAPDSWRGKSRADIEAYAIALYDKIEAENPQPDHVRNAGTILADCALDCWFQVRPPPPKLTLSPLSAQPRPV